MMARDLFQSLCGFDASFEGGYWVDTDLAMRVRQAELDIELQPLSVVCHQEGVNPRAVGKSSCAEISSWPQMAQPSIAGGPDAEVFASSFCSHSQ